jgi:hypothetical protein
MVLYCFVNRDTVHVDRRSIELAQAQVRSHAATYSHRCRRQWVGLGHPQRRATRVLPKKSAGTSPCRHTPYHVDDRAGSGSSTVGKPQYSGAAPFLMQKKESIAPDSLPRVKVGVERHPSPRQNRKLQPSRLYQVCNAPKLAIIKNGLDPFFQLATPVKENDLLLLQRCTPPR